MLYTNNAANLPQTTEITINGNMGVGGCDLVDLAKEHGTPLWVVDEEHLRNQCRKYVNTLNKYYTNSEVLFASKSLSVLATHKIIKEEGLGVDVVSGGELFIALKAGFSPEKIYFHGNNKTEREMREGIAAKIGTFVLDNYYEMEMLDKIAGELNVKQNVLVRVTPGIEAHTHEFIKTGQFDSKFGIHIDFVIDFLKELKKKSNLQYKGIHVHIGSQILEINPFAFAVEKTAELLKTIRDKTGLETDVLNLGGGMGISYIPKEEPIDLEEFAKTITQELQYRLTKNKLKLPKLVIEPGRSVVGTAGITLYTVGSIKEIKGIRKYVSVDGGMSDNARPITYQAKYDAVIANKIEAKKTETVTIAGKFCESGDILIKDILLPKLESGDTLVLLGTGAYGYSMSSNYNQVTKPAMVLVNQGRSKVIVERETYADLIKTHKE